MEEDINFLERRIKLNSQMYLEFGRLLSLDEETTTTIKNLINKYKEQEKIIELYEEKLMFALSPTTHELALLTKQEFKKIIRENINEDTYTIKKALKDYWNKKAKGE